MNEYASKDSQYLLISFFAFLSMLAYAKQQNDNCPPYERTWLKYVIPFILGGATLMSPASVSLNWQFEGLLNILQLQQIKRKLKVKENIDIDMINM